MAAGGGQWLRGGCEWVSEGFAMGFLSLLALGYAFPVNVDEGSIRA